MGPEICDELIDFITHLYTEEEAEVIQYITPLSLRNAKEISRLSKKPLDEVRKILQKVEKEKCSLLTFEVVGVKYYAILPIVPGTAEMVLYKTDPNAYTSWHKEFARRFEKLYNTGYIIHYFEHKPSNLYRFVPSYPLIKDNPFALPSDKLPEIFDRHSYIAVSPCLCRLSAKFNGHWCGRPIETCISFGKRAQQAVAQNRARKIELSEALEIKLRAEEAGLSNWIENHQTQGMEGNTSCSCCGDCCVVLLTITKFNKPGLIAPPHFMPKIDLEKCIHCGKCMQVCNTKAHQVSEEEHLFDALRCVGCGLCVRVCPVGALKLEPVPSYKAPPKNRLEYLAPLIYNMQKEKRRRKKEKII